MTRVTSLLLPLALALWAAPGPLAADRGLSQRIDIDIEEANLEEVLKPFGRVLEVGVVVEPGVEGEISLTLHNVSVRTVLDVICESAGCSWRLEEGEPGVLRFSPAGTEPSAPRATGGLDKKIDMSLVDAPAETVLASMAKILEAVLVLDLDLADAKVSIEVSNQTVKKSLDDLCAQLGCRWELTSEKPRTLRIGPAGDG